MAARQFYDRHFPVRPNLELLRHQAKDLLRALKNGDAAAAAGLRKHHSKNIDPAEAKLADAQFVLARSYGLASWPRLVTACHMTDAIWRGDVEAVRRLVLKDPRLLHEAARGMADSNWGPPMSYAANVGQDAIIQMLHDLGATDLQHAFDRACLQGKLETARRLYAMGARPTPGCVMGPCETLNAAGLSLLLELGAEFADNGVEPGSDLIERLVPTDSFEAAFALHTHAPLGIEQSIGRIFALEITADLGAEKAARDGMIGVATKLGGAAILHRDQHGAGIGTIEGANRTPYFFRHL